MKTVFLILCTSLLLIIGCTQAPTIDTSPYPVNMEADEFYQQAVSLSESYDVDSTQLSIILLDLALQIDSMNPEYHGLKAKLMIELGNLDEALELQQKADSIGVINGEYLFQLGLLQAAKDREEDAKSSFKRSLEYQDALLETYPDSFQIYLIRQAALACYQENDSLFMPDRDYVRKRFPNNLLDITMSKGLKPSNLIKQIKSLQETDTDITNDPVDGFNK